MEKNCEETNAFQKSLEKDAVISVSFPDKYKLSYYKSGGIRIFPDDFCMIQTDHGLEMGKVYSTVIPQKIKKLLRNLKPLIRLATREDILRNEKNIEFEQEAYDLCIRKIKEHTLPMKLVRVKFFFDRSKAIFYFTADGRVDFRELVKDLAYEFKTRIEMRQIGVRDEAKMIGGYGCCGLTLCCCAFLQDFEPVSIRMAKEQNLTLIPAKISGLCGRLMCCLNYEYDTYREIKKQFPKVGKKINTSLGEGRVCRINVIREKIDVEIPEKGIVEISKSDILTKNLPRKGIKSETPSKKFRKRENNNGKNFNR